jgi:pimeloyl-ACP methyl ester carboxylesterase
MAPHVVVEELSIRSIEQARAAYLRPGDDSLRARLARHHRDVDNAFWQWNDIWLDPAFRNFDIRSDCGRIQTPVLAVQGADDEYGTLRQIEDIQHQLPPAQALVLPQCGHSPHRDHPDALTVAVTRFLAAAA